MANYNTPGVYIEEISSLAPSVAQVATAVPAFIGYTEKGPALARVDSLLEYETLFGKAQPSAYQVVVQADSSNPPNLIMSGLSRSSAQASAFLMHYGISLYFRNGGGSCYIVSLGDYSKSIAKADFEDGLARLEAEDEPTLIVLLDAVNLKPADYYGLCSQALAQCRKLGDRFLLVDVVGGDADALRNANLGTDNLMYGAAYHPFLLSALPYQYLESAVSIQGVGTSDAGLRWISPGGGLIVSYSGNKASPKVTITVDGSSADIDFNVSAAAVLSIKLQTATTAAQLVSAWQTWKSQAKNKPQGFEILPGAIGSEAFSTPMDATDLDQPSPATLASIKATQTALYNQIRASLDDQRVILPPSAAMAGVYARIDRERGVWKAPGNVPITSVLGPVTKITNDDQDRLNIDQTAGRSINAIRSFSGKGTLAWGARTLAGNDNEWRYISVRRLFITIEESTRKATAFAVFEPNDATTWLKVKAMVEGYLYSLWEQGALAGSRPEQAYFVNVGLGKTMTSQDVLEGRMIVEIGVAAVRPAEFIILRFTHKLQEA